MSRQAPSQGTEWRTKSFYTWFEATCPLLDDRAFSPNRVPRRVPDACTLPEQVFAAARVPAEPQVESGAETFSPVGPTPPMRVAHPGGAERELPARTL